MSDIAADCCSFSIWHCCWLLWFQCLTLLLTAVVSVSDIAAECCDFSVWHCFWLLWFQCLTLLLNGVISVIIRQDLRGTGLGRRLMEATEQFAKKFVLICKVSVMCVVSSVMFPSYSCLCHSLVYVPEIQLIRIFPNLYFAQHITSTALWCIWVKLKNMCLELLGNYSHCLHTCTDVGGLGPRSAIHSWVHPSLPDKCTDAADHRNCDKHSTDYSGDHIYDKRSTSSSTADHRDCDKHSTDYGGEHWTYIMANAALVWLIAVTVTNTVRIMVESKSMWQMQQTPVIIFNQHVNISML